MARRGVQARQQIQKHVQEPMEQEEITRKRPWEKVDADARKTMLV